VIALIGALVIEVAELLPQHFNLTKIDKAYPDTIRRAGICFVNAACA